MSNRSEPNLEERLKHASEAKKLMLAKFKMALVEGPAAIEKRQQRQAIAAARAERAAQREEARQPKSTNLQMILHDANKPATTLHQQKQKSALFQSHVNSMQDPGNSALR
jgi:hypothetical protein